MSNTLQNYFSIDGQASTTWGIWINGDGRWSGAEPDVETVAVPGRNGELILSNNRWHNTEVYYRCFIPRQFKDNYDSFRAVLLNKAGYFRLEDTYRPNEYRMARVSGGLNISTIEWVNDTGTFTVRFNCKPQRYLKSGEQYRTITNGGTLENPTLYDALPIIRTKGYGTMTVTNGTYSCAYTIAQNSLTYYLHVSSEEEDCYADSHAHANRNSYLTLNNKTFPVLKPGTSTLTFSNTFTEVDVIPGWWTL